MAALVLKNIVKNYAYVLVISQGNLALHVIVETLFGWLVRQEGSSTSKKLTKEATAILAKIGFQEFIEFQVNEAPRDPSRRIKFAIELVFDMFATHSQTAIRVLNQIYKDASDDRLCKIAVPVLQNVDSFLKNNAELVASDSKLT